MIDTRLLGDGPPLGEVEALVIFAGVCRGVEALHKHTPPLAHRCVCCHRDSFGIRNVVLYPHGVLGKKKKHAREHTTR